MSRYTGPKARISRRLGTNIFGTVGEARALDKRPYPPGEHGRSRRRRNESEFLLQLQEKQKARFTYGLTEKQFRNLYDEASRKDGITGEIMLRFLELRLDNILYRCGWGATRPQARQLVTHRHVNVNGRRVDISKCLTAHRRPGSSRVTVASRSPSAPSRSGSTSTCRSASS